VPPGEAADSQRVGPLRPDATGRGSGLGPYLTNLHRGGHVARLKAHLDSVMNGAERFISTETLQEQTGMKTRAIGGCLAAMRDDPDFLVRRWAAHRRGETVWRIQRR
jgi:hypothetical protein